MLLLLDQVMRRFIRQGTFTVVLPDGNRKVYEGSRPGPSVGIVITSDRALHGLLVNSGLAFGEGYMNGEIIPLDCSLDELLTLLMTNLEESGHLLNQVEQKLRFLTRRLRQFNPRRRSRRNVAHHYDLNGELYKLFLDSDRQYSCAYFARDDMTLEEAQEAKKHHIASKLRLDRPDLTVLDIGCGWGGMALTLARDYGARVTGVTLSAEQLQEARQRAEAAGLSDRVRFELCDYRSVKTRFDRVVSVGMFEHVGVGHFDTFFRAIHDRLADDGIALVHSIGRQDGPGSTNPWLEKYIFPGGYSPALSETLAAVERSGLWMTDCEVLRLHYAKTIAQWRERFAAHREKIIALYDERFYRMFEFYLLGSELSFRIQGHMNFQLQLSRSIDAVPYVRDYMVEADHAHLS